MKFRIKYADRVVGLFVLLAALFLAASVVVLGSKQRWFARDYRFETILGSASGVSPGMAILMRGFQVGKIEELGLDERNQVKARFVIYDTYRSQVREYSLIELVTSPIGLGTQALFHPGRGEALLEEGALVPEASSEEGKAIIERELVDIPTKDDTITRLLAGLNPLLENVNKTVVTTNRTLTEVNRALAGQSSGPLGQIVADAAGAAASLDGLMSGVDGLVTEATKAVGELSGRASALLGTAEELTAGLGRISDNVEATTEALRDPTGLVPKLLDPKGSLKTLLDDKNQLYNRLSSGLAETEKTLKNVQAITTGLNAQMPSLAAALEETRTAIKQAQDVLEGLKNNPLIKGGVPERRSEESLYRSMREAQF